MQPNASESWIDRNLNLIDETDRKYLLRKLETRQNLPLGIEQIERAIAIIQDRLDDDWLTLYPFYSSAFASVKTGAKLRQTLDLFSTLIPLGSALLALKDLAGFDKLISKLRLDSYDRLSAILEALSAARYKIARFDVELEPNSRKGRFCDFRVRFENEWIYFECKKENLIESKYFRKAHEYANELIDLVLSKVEGKVPPTHRIDILLHRRPEKNVLTKLVESISEYTDAGQFCKWRRLGDIEFAVNSREVQISPPPELTVGIGRGTGDSIPKPVTQTMNIQVLYDPFGSKELQKARRLISEARTQLPQDSKSIIILESLHSRRFVKIAEEKLKQPGYENIVAILVTGDNVLLALNQRHEAFSIDFIKTAVLSNPF
jgi:hypothetical protein